MSQYTRANPANPQRVLTPQTSDYLGRSFERLKNHVLHFRHLWVNTMSFDDVVSDVVYTLSQKLLDRFDDGTHHDYPQFLAFQRESVRFCILEVVASKKREDGGLTFVEFDNTLEEELTTTEPEEDSEIEERQRRQLALIQKAIRTQRQREAAEIAKQDRLSRKDLGKKKYDVYRNALRHIRQRFPDSKTRNKTQ